MHFTTRTKHRVTRAALHGGKAITQSQVWQICHSVAEKPQSHAQRKTKARPKARHRGAVLRPTTPDNARPAIYMLNTTIQHTA